MSYLDPKQFIPVGAPQSALQAEIAAAVAPIVNAAVEEATRKLLAEIKDLKDPDPEWVSTHDAAKILGVNEQTIRNRFNAGKIDGMKQGNRILINLKALSP